MLNLIHVHCAMCIVHLKAPVMELYLDEAGKSISLYQTNHITVHWITFPSFISSESVLHYLPYFGDGNLFKTMG